MMKSNRSFVARHSWIAAAFVVVGIITFCKATEPAGILAGQMARVIGTPHFYQCDPRGQFPAEGRNYCCPTAVSDSLVYLGYHGFPRLLPIGIADPADAQIALIKRLASPDFMNTDPASGTNTGLACAAIQRHVEACGYVCKTIEYKGWRPMPRALSYYATGTIPSLRWIRKAAADPHGAAWVNIGWYVAGAASGEWKRVGGHWIAVVGGGVDANGHEDLSTLFIDNPAIPADAVTLANNRLQHRGTANGSEGPASDEAEVEVMTIGEIIHGRLTGSDPGLPRDAAGMYTVCGPGVCMARQFDAAFIDGAVALVIGDR